LRFREEGAPFYARESTSKEGELPSAQEREHAKRESFLPRKRERENRRGCNHDDELGAAGKNPFLYYLPYDLLIL
jgi:hypothetical protein